ncbi:MAG: hypothetical protein QJQ54_00260 [Mollicutes bacterium]|nr:MAG: hypothetical protein QJQ54_00260 [Mollicutes bacterium]
MSITKKTIVNLYTASGNQCAFEGCNEILKMPNDEHKAEAAHIRGKKKGSARYNLDMSDEERDNLSNLIVLCGTHHIEIDKNKSKYSVNDLIEMKKKHEIQVITKYDKQHPNDLEKILSIITNSDFKNYKETKTVNSFTIENKIKSNNVKKYRYILDKYKIYQTKLQTLYSELENEKAYRQEIFLNNVELFYLQAKGELLPEKATKKDIQQNADALIDRVLELLEKRIQNKQLTKEAIFHGLRIILVDAFMRCKILEEPKSYDN